MQDKELYDLTKAYTKRHVLSASIAINQRDKEAADNDVQKALSKLMAAETREMEKRCKFLTTTLKSILELAKTAQDRFTIYRHQIYQGNHHSFNNAIAHVVPMISELKNPQKVQDGVISAASRYINMPIKTGAFSCEIDLNGDITVITDPQLAPSGGVQFETHQIIIRTIMQPNWDAPLFETILYRVFKIPDFRLEAQAIVRKCEHALKGEDEE